jgi:hypothetical protein
MAGQVEYEPRTPAALFHEMAWRGVFGKGSAITLFRLFGGARLEAERLNYCFYKDLQKNYLLLTAIF